MEDEEAMQPSTQQSLDERKCGRNNSGMSKSDISDVICILHPLSRAAFRIVRSMARRNPQHVLRNSNSLLLNDDKTPLNRRETTIIRQNDQLDEESNTQSLALRFSSRTINQDLGFIFGRNTSLSDIIIAPDSARRVSDTHFRIYLSDNGDNGVLMLEDMSTNGTLVDHVHLRGKLGMSSSTRMLCSGSTIKIFRSKHEHVWFSVHLPSHEEHEEEYRRNYNAYLDAGPSSKKALPRSVSNPHGMHWNGGGRYNVVGLLKKCPFATVYMLSTIRGGQLLIAKELDKKRLMKNGQTDHLLDYEMRIMRTLRHPNIVQNIDYQDVGNYIYIITEYVCYGDLQDYLSNYGPLSEKLARSIAKQVLSALAYLHQKKITHRNIKPESVLIASVEPFVVKLTDFGLSKIVKNNNTFLKTFCGTLLYCAPEVFPYYSAPAFQSYSQLVDIWSFAAVLWYALYCEPPFKGVADYNERGMFERVMGTQLDPTRLKEEGVSDEACDLLIAMLNVDPAQRPTEQQCLEHPWLVDDEMILDLNNEPNGSGLIDISERENRREETRNFIELPNNNATICPIAPSSARLTSCSTTPDTLNSASKHLRAEELVNSATASQSPECTLKDDWNARGNGRNGIRKALADSIFFLPQAVVTFLGRQMGLLYRALVDPSENGIIFSRMEASSSMSKRWMRQMENALEALGVREKRIASGLQRLQWTCSCGKRLFDDFVELQPGALEDLRSRLESENTSRECSSGNDAPSPGGFFRFGRFLSHIGRTSRNRQGNCKSSPSPALLPTISSNNSSAPPGNLLYLLLCINNGDFGAELYHECIQHIKSDQALFHFFRENYFQRRGKLLTAVSLRTVSSINLVKFVADMSSKVDIYPHSIYCEESCTCMPPKSKVEPAPNSEYSCKPVPAPHIPPIGENYMMHLYSSPGCINPSQVWIYNQIPKRTRGQLVARPEAPAEGWGVHFREGWHWRKIWAVILTFFLGGSLLFGVLYGVIRRDAQSAFGIACYWITAATILLGYLTTRNA